MTIATTEDVDVLRSRLRDLETTLMQNDANIAATFKLTPAMSDLLGLLLTLPKVTSDMISQRLEIATDSKVAIYRLRKHMQEFDVKIHSVRNVGYWLDAEDKKKLRERMDAVAGCSPANPEPKIAA
jgi:DNA-binding response OmpR family regulator